MKIAVIGGGAAGVMTAHLLDEAHDVSLFEKQALLGGNIRTLGKNLPFATTREKESSIFLDSGVIEFEKNHNPVFDQLLKSLNVKTH
jgi:predicted NAD/FAD-binding protein